MSSAVQNSPVQSQVSSVVVESEGERNKELLRRLIDEGFSKGNLAVVDEIIAPDQQEHQFFGPNHPEGPEGVKDVINDLRSIFPDFTLTIDEMIAVDDKVWARATGRGTHGGKLMGRPPTGKRVEVAVIDICRFENGKMVEHWGVPDRFHMLLQLGLLPRPQDAPA